jgi:hypothetical protein
MGKKPTTKKPRKNIHLTILAPLFVHLRLANPAKGTRERTGLFLEMALKLD